MCHPRWVLTGLEFALSVLGVAVLGIGLFVLAAWRCWTPPIWVALLVAFGFRAVTVLISVDHTPHDVGLYFQHAGQLVLDRHDPATGLPEYQWNFLPLMPYLFALELSTGLSWEIGGKLVPVLADLVVVALLGQFAAKRFSKQAPLLYAVCPVPILVSAVHGQVEPVALALGLGALLMARRHAPFRAGALAGLAIATKTWPVILGVGVVRDTPPRSWWRLALPAGAALLALLLSVKYLLRGSLHEIVHVLTGYRSLVGAGGWTGALNALGIAGWGYSGPNVEVFQRIGTVLMVVAVGTILVLFRRADGVVLTAALLLAILIVSAGFGVQYLVWPLPYVLLLRRRAGLVFAAAASIDAAFMYPLLGGVSSLYHGVWKAIYIWGSLPVLGLAFLAIPWALRHPEPEVPQESASPEEDLDDDRSFLPDSSDFMSTGPASAEPMRSPISGYPARESGVTRRPRFRRPDP